jgi:VIT1/CCC1 family predicted Fe2+/Mn2+ transporter
MNKVTEPAISKAFYEAKSYVWSRWEFIGIAYATAAVIYIIFYAFEANSLLIATAVLIILPLAYTVARGVWLYAKRTDK